MPAAHHPTGPAGRPHGWLLLLLAAVVVYLTGLDSLYLPSNGDEMVYSHIARLTAASGHWLPLVSDLDHMRNTKPPLLFWQAMVAGDWGQHWDLWRLRLPAVLYTLALTAGIAALAWRMARRTDTALIAACVYLAFFSSFRFGRPYLTSAAETFWLSLPMAGLLWRQLRPADARPASTLPATAPPGWGLLSLWGLAWGLGLAYKSFALVVPAAASLWCALLLLERLPQPGVTNTPARPWLASLLDASLRVGWSTLVAVAVFGLWFALDPDPGAVWREFVVGENAGKLAREGWRSATTGTLVQALAYVENAGPLALVVLGLGLQALVWAWQRRGTTPGQQVQPSAGTWQPWSGVLLAWLLVWGLIFCIPSQRSARYVIPAMPALALLVALYWQRLARGWFIATLLVCLPVLLLLGVIAQSLYAQGVASPVQAGLALVALMLGLGAVLAGLAYPRWVRGSSLACAIAVYALLNGTLAPLSGPAGQFAVAPESLPAQVDVAVPSTFNAQYERYQFLLPTEVQARIRPYTPTQDAAQLTELLGRHGAVVWPQNGGDSDPPACAQARPATCRIVAARWDLRTRHQPGDIRLQNLLYPEQWLLRREWLVVPLAGIPSPVLPGGETIPAKPAGAAP